MMRVFHPFVRFGSLFTVASTLVVACGGGDESVFGEPPPENGSAGSSRGSSGNASTGNVDGGDGASEFAGCATEQRKAEPLPLDLYVMLDTSGSMSTQVAQSVSKYKAVSDALGSFVTDPGSAGIGI